MDLHSAALVENFTTKLKRRKVVGSFAVAMETAEIFKHVVSKSQCKTPEALIQLIKEVGRKLVRAAPIEVAVGNVTRRVLYFVREEVAHSHAEGHDSPPPDIMRSRSLENFLLGDNKQKSGIHGFSKHLKPAIVQQIEDLVDEIHAISSNIAEQSLEHIHANELILSIGFSLTVVNFLRFAAQKGRKFEVMVAETAPRFSGHELARELAAYGIQVTVLPDSAIFAVMSRVNKVIVGTHAVLANGGLCAPSGMHHVALAAKHHSVPVVVCTGLYKLSPLFAHDQDTFNQLRSPCDVLGSEEAMYNERVRVLNPEFDYVPPDLLSLYITNLGGHNPSYIYRLLAELYSPEDYSLETPPGTAPFGTCESTEMSPVDETPVALRGMSSNLP
mmetsp:Transcript_10251/g.23373  ORF Transcript_10251/g.23373 Transcript_10251/m.23373 type:complete len:387 (+) Transcript_10251:1-1161(+)